MTTATPTTPPTTDVTPAPATGNPRGTEERSAFAMAAPAVILLTLFLIIPAAFALGLSFTNARLISPNTPEFVGISNYQRALTADPTFLRSILNTFYFAAVVVPVQAGFALVLALLINRKIRAVNAFRTIYFMPVVTSMVVVSILWTFMYQETGLINSAISALTGGALEGQAWLANPATAMPAIMVLSIWQGVGFHMIVWLSGLQTIPGVLYEAADIDGATPWQMFRHVTLPGLKPTLVFIVITITIAALGLFVQIDVMTRGGPLESTTTLIFHAIRKGYREQEVGYGAALSLIFFAIVLVVSLIQQRIARED